MAGCAIASRVSNFASVVVLESGPQIAQEGAAQNAGLIRRLDPEPCDRALAQRTFAYLCDQGPDLSTQVGAILGLVRDPLGLHDACAHLKARGVQVHTAEHTDFPLLHGAPISKVWHLPDERVANGPNLAHHLLDIAKSNGAQLQTNRTAHELIIEQGQCVGAKTTDGPIIADLTVVACGAWSGILATKAGLDRPLFPLRRMAAVASTTTPITSNHPWCWLDDVGLYAKQHGKGWLISPCDEQLDTPSMGISSTGQPNESQWRLLNQKIHHFLPRLIDGKVVQSWTGLRTFCPDRRPLLGEDGECSGLYWAAGLGGSGLSSCIGVADALAAWIQSESTDWLDPQGVSPNRYQLFRWPIFPDGDPNNAKLINRPSILAR